MSSILVRLTNMNMEPLLFNPTRAIFTINPLNDYFKTKGISEILPLNKDAILVFYRKCLLHTATSIPQ